MKIEKNKSHLKYRNNLFQQLGDLDARYKLCPLEELKEEIQWVIGAVKPLDARGIAKDVMYARQRIFEYHDKPGRQLARILADTSEVKQYELKNGKGKMYPSQRKN